MTPPIDLLNAALSGRYRIERELGAGGMATVYLAEDLKHKRKVALKVLKPELAAVLGAERFVQEITTTASLQHPHILPLFDSGEADGFLFYVMPFIDGETLRVRLDRETQLGAEEAVAIAVSVADALDYAHRHGVIHRDIKPENILLHEGRPVVADFGIALAVSAAAGGRMTETGLSLGTPHYMSPEQATAEKEITARSDVYSLASVLYEMLAGQPPHLGGSAQQIIMKIIAEPVDPVTRYRKSVPPNVAAAVARALEKLPADRFQSAKAFAEALASAGYRYTPSAAETPSARTRVAPSLTRSPLVAAAGVILLVAGVAGGVVWGRRGLVEAQVVRFALTLPEGHSLYPDIMNDAPFALAPDGRTVAMVARNDSSMNRRVLYVRSLDEVEGRFLPGTEGAVAPFFSPDGKWIGFHEWPTGRLKKVAVTGGPTILLAEDASNRQGASWGDDNSIVYVRADRELSRVNGAGGVPDTVTRGDSTSTKLWPSMLPGSKAVLAERCNTNACTTHDLVAVELSTGKATVIVPGATRGWYAPSGHLVYATREGTVYAVRFNARTLRVNGEPIPLLEGLETTSLFGARLGIASASGTMAYLAGGSAGVSRVVAMDRAGRERTVISRPAQYSNPRWSPDSKRIAVQRQGASGGSQIWVWSIADTTFTQVTRDGDNVRPTWSPNGERLAFTNNGIGLSWSLADGSQPPEVVFATGSGGLSPFWTRDGQWITFDGLLPGGTAEDIYAVATQGKHTPQVAVRTPGNDQLGAVSPDGKWIAYISDESETNKVYLRRFQSPDGGKLLISTGSASEPVWVSDHELTYTDDDTRSLILAELRLGETAQVVRRTRLFDISPYLFGNPSWWDYDVTRDGREFLFLRPNRTARATLPVVMLNWTDAIKRRMREQGRRR